MGTCLGKLTLQALSSKDDYLCGLPTKKQGTTLVGKHQALLFENILRWEQGKGITNFHDYKKSLLVSIKDSPELLHSCLPHKKHYKTLSLLSWTSEPALRDDDRRLELDG